MRRAGLSLGGCKLIGVLASASLLACQVQSGFGRATVVEPGHLRFAALAEAQLATVRALPETDIPLPGLQLAVGAGYGVSRRVELGGRVWGIYSKNLLSSFGGSLDAKLQLRRAKVDVALVSSLSYEQLLLGGAPWHSWGVTVPLLFGVNLGPHQFVLGPRLVDYVVASYGQNTINTFWGGASLGFAWHARRNFDLIPELTWLWSPVQFNGEASTKTETGASLLQLGIGGHFVL